MKGFHVIDPSQGEYEKPEAFADNNSGLFSLTKSIMFITKFPVGFNTLKHSANPLLNSSRQVSLFNEPYFNPI